MKRQPFLVFFEISTEMHYVSLFLLNERNITTSLLMIRLNCTVVHYANVNSSSSSINKPYLRTVEYAILFFLSIEFVIFLIYIYFDEASVKNFI